MAEELLCFPLGLCEMGDQGIGKVTPYGTAGAGLMKIWGDSEREFGTRFTVNYGGGIKFNRAIGPLSVRVDVRGYTAPNIPFRNELG
jgi:hypothetical protein